MIHDINGNKSFTKSFHILYSSSLKKNSDDLEADPGFVGTKVYTIWALSLEKEYKLMNKSILARYWKKFCKWKVLKLKLH